MIIARRLEGASKAKHGPLSPKIRDPQEKSLKVTNLRTKPLKKVSGLASGKASLGGAPAFLRAPSIKTFTSFIQSSRAAFEFSNSLALASAKATAS
jgi:hypothetical protein